MNQYQKVAFYTLGCKLNFSETSTIARQLADAGFAKVDFQESEEKINETFFQLRTAIAG